MKFEFWKNHITGNELVSTFSQKQKYFLKDLMELLNWNSRNISFYRFENSISEKARRALAWKRYQPSFYKRKNKKELNEIVSRSRNNCDSPTKSLRP